MVTQPALDTGVILQVCPGFPSPLYSLSVCSPLSWSWQIYSGRCQPPPATRLLTHGICQVGATRRLPKPGTVAETFPLPLSLPSPQELNSEDLLPLLPPLPILLHAQEALLQAVVPRAHPCCVLHISIPLCPAPFPSSTASLLLSDMKPKAEPAASAWAGAADPWVPVPATGGEPLSQASASSQQTSAGPWDFPPGTTTASDPWGKAPLTSGFPPADPWATASPPAQAAGSTPAPDPWAAVAEQPPNPGKSPDRRFGFAGHHRQRWPSLRSCKWASRGAPPLPPAASSANTPCPLFCPAAGPLLSPQHPGDFKELLGFISAQNRLL